jgi:hypothetical protein
MFRNNLLYMFHFCQKVILSIANLHSIIQNYKTNPIIFSTASISHSSISLYILIFLSHKITRTPLPFHQQTVQKILYHLESISNHIHAS